MKKPFLQKTAILLCVVLFLLSNEIQATVRYVKTDGSTTAANAANATTWTAACSDLQAVINASSADDEIWVANGTYKPEYKAGDGTQDRDKAFVLVKDVKLYGGFAGTETAVDQRTTGSSSILSGDIGTVNDNSDNCYHVLIAADDVGTALLDGFTVTGGNANGTDNITVNTKKIDRLNSGGMVNISSSPTLTNCSFTDNTANLGGGMINYSSSPTLTNCSFTDNTANLGGGMYNDSSSPTLTNCSFANNIASDGGGMKNFSSSPILTNCNFANNTANYGGGMYNYSSSPALTNCIIFDNTATTNNNVYNDISTPTYSFSLIQGSGGSSAWEIDFGIDDDNNIDVDPKFTDAANGDFTLQAGSPCINAGNSSANATDKDLAGNPRIFGTVIDMGAYEYQSTETSLIIANQ